MYLYGTDTNYKYGDGAEVCYWYREVQSCPATTTRRQGGELAPTHS
jgi:hypothetical protein